MSRIGKNPVAIPEGVSVDLAGQILSDRYRLERRLFWRKRTGRTPAVQSISTPATRGHPPDLVHGAPWRRSTASIRSCPVG